ncbi:AfsR/SARP family transcriptional regulator [Streptomyces erythrochromogenes]|uniref:AfsR/SARP family transcriptional regulator n=1 Tax=Streptomyces erythrochromogenes TaxID=285574 RepID=UPI00341D627D
MQFRILGPVEIHDERRGLRIVPTGSKQRVLLGALVVKAGHLLSYHRLIDELWGEHPPANPANALQAHVARLRKLLEDAGPTGQERIDTHALGYQLHTGPDATDAGRFHRLCAQGRAVIATDPEQAVHLLRQALALWRGPALQGSLGGDICLAEAAQLEENRLVALETLYEAGLRAGLHHEITGELEELIGDNPVRERFYELLMVALHRCGRQAEALGTYERARTRLADELGVEPGAALRRRVRSILSPGREQPAPAVARPAAPVVRSLPPRPGTAGQRAAATAPQGGAVVLDLGDELARLRRRLENLTREQEDLARRMDQLTARTAAAR